jgi:hypothetical protein
MIDEIKNNIKRLIAVDFDGCLINSFSPEAGKLMYEKYYQKKFPWNGWWGRPESLDLNVFDIKPFPSVLNQLKEEQAKPNTYVIILTSRMEKLRPQVQAVLDVNHIVVDKLVMRHAESDKGKKILRYLIEFPELNEINVYDDRDKDIQSYIAIRNQIPKDIRFNIYLAKEGKISLLENKFKILNIIREEIRNILKN